VKFSVNTKELIRVLSNIQGIIDKSGQNQLSNVFLHAIDDKLVLNATNNQLTLLDKIDASIEEEGLICVKAHRFLQVVRSLNDSITSISLKRMILSVTSGKARFNIKECSPADDFPPYAPPQSEDKITIKNSELRRMLGETIFSIMKPERQNLNGASVELHEKTEGNYFRMVTTDGTRLSISEIPYSGSVDSSKLHQILIPQKALQELLQLTNSYGDQSWTLVFGEKKACFSIENLEFSFTLLTGKFPEYNMIIKKILGEKNVQIDKKYFSSVLKRVSVFHSKNANSVMFSFSPNQLEVSFTNSDIGDFRESFEVDYTHDAFSISFNLSFFQELLGALDAEIIQLEMDDPMRPCLITVPKRNDCSFVIMPMRHNT